MAEREAIATFRPDVMSCDERGAANAVMLVFADGGVEIHRRGQDPIVLKRARPPANEHRMPEHLPEFKHITDRWWSWFDMHSNWWPCSTGFTEAPRLCPPHLPVFGVVEEPRDG